MPEQRKFEELINTVAFELERDLRLLPQKLEIGKVELLTDSIRLSYKTIQQQLHEFAMAPSPARQHELRTLIKRYLTVLNANPLFPLDFRLKVLATLEEHLDLFDAEITSQVLNAHKIGIQMVQKEARKKPEYLPPLVNLVANALELAERLLFDTLRQHRAPHVITLRQALDLMRLGLVIAPSVGEEASEDVHRLNSAIAAHELLRCMDLYARTEEQQRLVRREIQRYAERINPVLYLRNQPLPNGANVYLITRLNQPHLPPAKLTRLPASAESDLLVMPLHAFLAGINRDLKLAGRVAAMEPGKRKLLMTEQRFKEIKEGTVIIRQALQTVNRKSARYRIEGAKALLEAGLNEAFGHLSDHGPCLTDAMLSDAEKRSAWSLVNISEDGAAMQRLGESWDGISCGAIVGIRWIGERVGPGLGIVRWFRENKPGEQSIGIEFIRSKLAPTRGLLLGEKSNATPQRCNLLFEPDNPKRVWFPSEGIEEGDRLIYLFDGEGMRCHIARVLRKGPNFSYCELAFDVEEGTKLSIQADSLR